jgi:hypothetical protein
LFGLALQFTLSFGHIHHKDVLGPSSASTESAVVAELEEPGASHTDDEQERHENEYCAIYAINSLIGSAQGIEPPALSVPALIVGIRFPTVHNFRLTQSPYVLSRARAPPLT